MKSFFEIASYNTQTLYFWGAEADAARYVGWLNRDLEINTYSLQAIPEAEWAEYEGREDVLSAEEAYWDDFMDTETA